MYIINVKISKIVHHEILSEEEFFGNFMQTLALIVLATCMLVCQRMIVLQNVVLIQTL